MQRGIEYCPVTAGVDVLGDRWILLVVRELLLGSHRFNDIHRGLPGVSRTLLSARLRRMQTQKLVTRSPDADGRPEYRLTEAGAALEPLVWHIGKWAREWSFDEPAPDQLDANALMWRVRQFVQPEALPARRVVVEFTLRAADVPDERAWLVLAPGGDVSTCRMHPGQDPDVWVTADLAEMHRLSAGTSTLAEARRTGLVRVDGDPRLVADFPGWFVWRKAEADFWAREGAQGD